VDEALILIICRIEVSHVLLFYVPIKRGKEAGDIYGFSVILLKFIEKFILTFQVCLLKCYSIFRFESQSDILVFLALDLCTGLEAVIFSRHRCVSGTTRSPVSFLRLGFPRSCSRSGQRPRVLPPHGRSLALASLSARVSLPGLDSLSQKIFPTLVRGPFFRSRWVPLECAVLSPVHRRIQFLLASGLHDLLFRQRFSRLAPVVPQLRFYIGCWSKADYFKHV
jgi:hypothetical protein